jgi:hypothetical protein
MKRESLRLGYQIQRESSAKAAKLISGWEEESIIVENVLKYFVEIAVTSVILPKSMKPIHIHL